MFDPGTLDPGTLDPGTLYQAYASRDPRFDGVFFVGVTSTGIYCRPVCTAKTPKAENCRFFASAAAAEGASFRPCLRCRPELAPGNAPVDGAQRVAQRIVARLGEGMVEEGVGLEAIAAEFGMSSRQVRRIVHAELGVSPLALVQTRRLLLAKHLLTETRLQIIDVAHASGFSSLRRFNAAFRRHYGMPPTRLRKDAADVGAQATTTSATTATLTLRLAYRPPYAWQAMLSFLGARALGGVERVQDGAYLRTVRHGDQSGWIEVRDDPARNALRVEASHALVPLLPAVLGRVEHLFDLGARPDVIATHLARDARLARSVASSPGLRVPGAFDGFEVALRAILGQQVTVKGASTLAGRLVRAFGESIETPVAGLAYLSPTPARLAAATVGEVASLGIVRTRARSVIALAEAIGSGRLRLTAGSDVGTTVTRLVELPGIGPWTAQYIVMRVLRWPDAFPKEDVVLRKRLGGVNALQAEARSQPWRPWRSYAAMHLWHGGAESD